MSTKYLYTVTKFLYFKAQNHAYIYSSTYMCINAQKQFWKDGHKNLDNSYFNNHGMIQIRMQKSGRTKKLAFSVSEFLLQYASIYSCKIMKSNNFKSSNNKNENNKGSKEDGSFE